MNVNKRNIWIAVILAPVILIPVAVAGLYRLRRRPNVPRPYKVPGYPVLPAIFIAGVAYLVGNALFADPLWTSVTFAIVLAGVPVYYVCFASKPPKFRPTPLP